MTPTTPLPESYEFPLASLQKWAAMPASAQLGSPITKGDVDNLFFALDHIIGAQVAMQTSLIAYTQGDLDSANGHVWETSRRLIEGQNKLRQFVTGIMTANS